ncbi:MAG: hypothetical protein ACR2PI_22150 [Hyphomicrobiaceae bacterium]
MLPSEWTTAGLWLAVVGSGIYHGINPGMGWPLAVSAGLMGNGRRDLLAALWPLTIGHFLAMAGILLPFALMTALVTWQHEIRVGAGLLVLAAGIFLLVNRRHPRFLARIRPTQLALWSFAVAMAHGAGLMLVPIYLGLCRAEELDAGHQAAFALMGGNLVIAVVVASVHAVAMVVSGGVVAVAVHAWLGLEFLSKSWFNLDVVWALSLILVGTVSLSATLGAL